MRYKMRLNQSFNYELNFVSEKSSSLLYVYLPKKKPLLKESPLLTIN